MLRCSVPPPFPPASDKDVAETGLEVEDTDDEDCFDLLKGDKMEIKDLREGVGESLGSRASRRRIKGKISTFLKYLI